jgi:hypothetical protein
MEVLNFNRKQLMAKRRGETWGSKEKLSGGA